MYIPFYERFYEIKGKVNQPAVQPANLNQINVNINQLAQQQHLIAEQNQIPVQPNVPVRDNVNHPQILYNVSIQNGPDDPTITHEEQLYNLTIKVSKFNQNLEGYINLYKYRHIIELFKIIPKPNNILLSEVITEYLLDPESISNDRIKSLIKNILQDLLLFEKLRDEPVIKILATSRLTLEDDNQFNRDLLDNIIGAYYAGGNIVNFYRSKKEAYLFKSGTYTVIHTAFISYGTYLLGLHILSRFGVSKILPCYTLSTYLASKYLAFNEQIEMSSNAAKLIFLSSVGFAIYQSKFCLFTFLTTPIFLTILTSRGFKHFEILENYKDYYKFIKHLIPKKEVFSENMILPIEDLNSKSLICFITSVMVGSSIIINSELLINDKFPNYLVALIATVINTSNFNNEVSNQQTSQSYHDKELIKLAFLTSVCLAGYKSKAFCIASVICIGVKLLSYSEKEVNKMLGNLLPYSEIVLGK